MADPPITIRAHAKINLCLDVLGRRSDGMHEVATILQTIDLADRLQLTYADELSLRCHGMAPEPDNLILRAARLLQGRAGTRRGCAIECWKRIPIGAGLGGGSVDAAATLVALNLLWGVDASLDELATMAATLGADVPFGLRGGTALATGVGATLQPLADAPPHWLVLVPIESGEETKTAAMYRALTPDDFSGGERTQRQMAAISGRSLGYADVASAFTRAARERWPEVDRAMKTLARSRPLAVCVSGAGPSVFALFASRGAARAARNAIGSPARVHRFTPASDVGVARYTAKKDPIATRTS